MGTPSSAPAQIQKAFKMQLSTIVALVGLAALTQAATIPVSSDDWEQFKEIHGKVYRDHEEEIYRKSIFEENLKHIREHNEEFISGLTSFSKSANQFADMHIEEIIGGGLKQEEIENEDMYQPGPISAPEAKDWRKEDGVVSAVKNQAQCGSCWAFSATGSLEGQMMLKKNKKVSLSEQQLVDCAGGSYGNHGCSGGLMGYAFAYIKDVGGIESEAAYPYKARQMTCKADKSKYVASVTGYKRLPRGSEEALKQAVAEVGPISVAIQATRTMQLYRGGVMVDRTCSPTRLNHGVLAVGYGHDESSGLDYWIVKNSWGGSWGEAGFIKMARNHRNMCGIATQASYPTV